MEKKSSRSNPVLRVLPLLVSILMLVVGCSGETSNAVHTSAGEPTAAEDLVYPTQPLDPEDTAAPPREPGAFINNMTIAGNPIKDYRIVYDDTVFAKECATRVRDAITEATGYILPMETDFGRETAWEILVGKTNRDASQQVRAAYDRPNVYYTVTTVGSKLVVMGEGQKTLERVATVFSNRLSRLTAENPEVAQIDRHGDILESIDTLEVSMVNRAKGTDLRVFHWNMAAPYLNPSVTPPPVVYDSNVTRGEVMADIILQLLPDIITTNEFYESHNGDHTFFNSVMNELKDYYVCLDSPYDVDKPEVGADVIKNKTINCNIIYRKDAGLSVVGSAWRYSTEKTTVSSSNPGGWVYYHGSHTAVFSLNGRRFILSVSHYADSRSDSKWAKEQLAAVADAQALYGNGGSLPVILTGDMYTGYTSSSANSGYKYLAAQGYIDSQRNALVNANNNISHGTFHTVGVRQTTRISEDFVWHTSELQALCFKVLTSQEIDDTSDHYPVMADLKLL